MRKLVTTAFILLTALPAFPDAREAQPDPQPLRLMSDDEFAGFLTRLETGVTRWKVDLSHMDLRSLSSDRQESAELERSQERCLQSLGSVEKEIQSLSQKQSLRLDFLLLVDLNGLARNLDQLDRELIDVNGGEAVTARKSLEYARGVLDTDTALALYVGQFQRHLLAYAGVIDATLDQTEAGVDPAQTQDEASSSQRNETYANPIKEEFQ